MAAGTGAGFATGAGLGAGRVGAGTRSGPVVGAIRCGRGEGAKVATGVAARAGTVAGLAVGVVDSGRDGAGSPAWAIFSSPA